MKFDVSGAEYDCFMGRYSAELAPLFADFARVQPGMRVLDVGCGTGILTRELVRRVGASEVSAIDPAEPLLAACRARLPEVDARLGPAEKLPWSPAAFDAVLAQLVVSFMADAPRALAEMRRVLCSSGTLAACMWALGDAMQLLDLFWRAALVLDSHAFAGEVKNYRTPDDLSRLWQLAGASQVEVAPLDVQVRYADFDDYWASILTAAGPVGAYVAPLSEAHREGLREQCRAALGQPKGTFSLQARAWAVRGQG
jgi:ubiquinone/menaquinone biosynthesis C-methylase UbiE